MTDTTEAVERVLCFNVLLDESRKDVGVFRHPLYAYNEALAWPPRKLALSLLLALLPPLR